MHSSEGGRQGAKGSLQDVLPGRSEEDRSMASKEAGKVHMDHFKMFCHEGAKRTHLYQ